MLLRCFGRRREEIFPEGSPYLDYRFMVSREAVGPMAAISGAHFSMISRVPLGLHASYKNRKKEIYKVNLSYVTVNLLYVTVKRSYISVNLT